MVTPNSLTHNSSYYLLIEEIANRLFEGEYRRLTKNVEKLTNSNNEIIGSNFSGFYFGGEFYTSDHRAHVKGAPKTALHPELTSKGEWHVKSAKKVADDRSMISQILFKLMSSCESLQAMRDTLPDFVAEIIPALRSLPRTPGSEPGDTLKHHDSSYRQFKKLLERMEFYAAARLMY